MKREIGKRVNQAEEQVRALTGEDEFQFVRADEAKLLTPAQIAGAERIVLSDPVWDDDYEGGPTAGVDVILQRRGETDADWLQGVGEEIARERWRKRPDDEPEPEVDP